MCFFFFFKNGKSISSSFFFSSRRRHTRSDRDWSSDVCSSDLAWLSAQIAAGDLRAQPRGLFGAALTPQKFIDIPQAGTRQDALVADVAEFAGEEFQQLDLLGAARREITVPALGGHRVIFVALPDQRRFAQTCPSGKHCDIAVRRRIFRAVQNRELGWLQMN